MTTSYEFRTSEALDLATGWVYYFDGEDPTGRVRPLIDRALNGEWRATGRRTTDDGEPPLDPEAIPADWWEFLVLDVGTDSASGGGIEIVGLRWFEDQGPGLEAVDDEKAERTVAPYKPSHPVYQLAYKILEDEYKTAGEFPSSMCRSLASL